jgi:hypothetical protein
MIPWQRVDAGDFLILLIFGEFSNSNVTVGVISTRSCAGNGTAASACPASCKSSWGFALWWFAFVFFVTWLVTGALLMR